MPDSILNRLRQETAQPHRELEDAVQISRRIGSPSGYRDLLELFFGYYGPMEQALATAHSWNEEGLDFEARRKAAWLGSDLAALGLSQSAINALPACEELPSMPDAATAFGCWYVLEGSTLGGRHISAMLDNSTIDPGARRFFHGYGSETGAMWRQFCESLEGFARHHDGDAMVRGAAAAFSCLHTWISQSSPVA